MKKLLLLMAISIPAISYAQKTISGNDIVITYAIHEDLYIMGGNVTVNAPIAGDLIVGGGTIIINDTVSGDIMAFGGKITINGFVGDDLRGVGGEVYLNGQVQGDLVMSAGTVTSGKNSIVMGNTLLGAGTSIIDGKMDGNLKCRSSIIKFSGEVKKEADCRGESIAMNGIVWGGSKLAASQIQIGDQAAFYQDVFFWHNKPMLDFKQAMKHGDALYEPTLEIDNSKWQYLGFTSALFLIWYLAAAFILILIMQYLFGKILSRAAAEAFTHTMRSVGFGFLFLISVPAAILVLMITLIGIPVGILLMVGYLILVALASVISSLVIANWINKRNNYNFGTGVLSLIGLLIFILLKFITLIPIFGWIMILIICALSFGSIIADILKKRDKGIKVL